MTVEREICGNRLKKDKRKGDQVKRVCVCVCTKVLKNFTLAA